MEEKKKFSLFTTVLTVICVVFVAEAAAPVAAIGNSQFFWWLFLLIAFLLPYGLISAELGTTYIGDGGIYDWVTKAFGHRWGSRTSWYYWINFPLWLASLAVMTPGLLTTITGVEFSTFWTLLIELVFIWLIIWISFYPASDSVWILNGAAIIKMILALLVGVLGLYIAFTKGMANKITLDSLLPSFDLNSLSFISVIIFNLLGFEVICTCADDMENPKKQIPQSIIVAAIYIFSAFGIGVAIPVDKISTSSGMMDSFKLLTGSENGWFIILMAFLFLLTLFGNMISWSLGVNNTACYAAENGDMPKFFAKRSKKNNMPIGSAPAFYKLRKIDPETPRPFKVGGSDFILKIMVVIPIVMILISLLFTAFPLSFDEVTLADKLPVTIGSLVCLILGEVIIRVKKIKK